MKKNQLLQSHTVRNPLPLGMGSVNDEYGNQIMNIKANRIYKPRKILYPISQKLKKFADWIGYKAI